MLLETYTSTNRSTSVGLAVRYVVELVDYSYYRVTRYASKTYAFVGMTHEAAKSCELAKTAQYTNAHAVLGEKDEETGIPTGDSVTSCAASIRVYPDGSRWVCEISVNESDVVAVAQAPDNPATLFEDAERRNYDETTTDEILSISSVTREGSAVVIGVNVGLESMSPAAIAVEWKQSATEGTWTRCAAKFDKQRGKIVATGIPAGAVVRLNYGGFASSAVSA